MPLINIYNKNVEYKFEIHGKYTIIRGDSATGKTTLCDLVTAFNRKAQGITNLSSLSISVFPQDEYVIRAINPKNFVNHIFLLDEDSPILHMHGYERLFKLFNCYFVFFTRTLQLKNIPISAASIYNMHSSGKYHTLKPVFCQFPKQKIDNVDVIITEDSKSGALFVGNILRTAYVSTEIMQIKADGNADVIVKLLKAVKKYKNIVVMYDYSGMGLYVDSVQSIVKSNPTINFYIVDWQSFEHYILASNVLKLNYTLDDIGCNYESLEQFATERIMCCYPIKYTKERLITCLQRNGCKYCTKHNLCTVSVYKYDDYIYDKLEPLYDCIHKEWRNRARGIAKITYTDFCKKVDSLKQLNKGERVIKSLHIDTTDFVFNLCKCSDTKSGSVVMSITDLVNKIMSNMLVISNPSMLKEWVGFVEV